MNETHGTATGYDKPRRFELRIRGHLDDRRADWFGGPSFSHESDGTTILSGPVVDRAASHSLPRKVRGLGMPLLSEIQSENKCTWTVKERSKKSLSTAELPGRL